MIRARDFDSVTKMKLVSLQSRSPDRPIFIFEGADDKIVYRRWITRLCPHLKYEAFVANGKKEVRKSKEVSDRDKGNLGRYTFFFIDRDYDDMKGFANSERTFMTDRYAVENYLIEPCVLEQILQDEFPCHEYPEVRSKAVNLYVSSLSEFLRHLRDLNLRIFIGRTTSNEILNKLDDRVSPFGTVEYSQFESQFYDEKILVHLQREPTAEEYSSADMLFSNLDAMTRHRGKYLLKFFRSWLESLCAEFRSRNSSLFDNVPQTGLRQEEMTIGNFAFRSPVPEDLENFLGTVTSWFENITPHPCATPR